VAKGSRRIAALVVGSLLALASSTPAADLKTSFSGNLLGIVSDPTGTPQMGAAVLLFDRYQNLVRRTFTTADGRFGFPELPPDLYSVRVSVPRLFPAVRNKVEVKAGLSSVLEIHLASLVSSVEVRYTVPTGSMSDDWKWALRSSTATRPITRFMPGPSASSSTAPRQSLFSSTRGILSVGGGDGTMMQTGLSQDMGTAFAISTDLYGKHSLQVSGSVGQSVRSGLPIAAMRATYSPGTPLDIVSSPEITVSMQQVSLPLTGIFGPAMADNDAALRGLGVSFYEKADPLARLHLEYGSSFDSVNYFTHVNRVSPFARATYNLGNFGSLIGSFSNGATPTDLLTHQAAGIEGENAIAMSVLSQLPLLSFRQGVLEVQRTRNSEIGLVRISGSRTYGISAFYEDVQDGQLSATGNLAAVSAGNILSDIGAKTSILNIGNFNRHGVVASVDQRLGGLFDVQVAYGVMGGLNANGKVVPTGSMPDSFLDRSDRGVASLDVHGVVPYTGTHITGDYGWVAGGAIVPQHLFTTQQLYVTPGLNFVVRQPLPNVFGLPGHIELTAELRNLLAQGYVPISTPDGRTILLVQSPRAIRGAVNFIF
jgi:Carboxypeptidase regulatory-like domain/TonB dependent receptor